MANDLAGIRDRVELELRDSGNAEWSTGEIDSYLRRALMRVNEVLPVLSTGTLDAVADTWEYSLSTLTGLLYVEDVWYPWDASEPRIVNHVGHRMVGASTMRLEGVESVSADYDIRVFYRIARTIKDLDSASATTLTVAMEEAVVMGAAAYAAIAAGVESINAVTVNGWTPRQWLEWGRVREEQFNAVLEGMRVAAMSALDGRVEWELDWGC